MPKYSKKETEEARAELLKTLKPGDTVYCILRHVSKSGMARWIDLYTIQNNEMVWLSWLASRVLGEPVNTSNHEGIRTSGAGMDMGFWLVYRLGRALWPDGFDTPEGYWRNEPLTHDPDGGYALKHRWV